MSTGERDIVERLRARKVGVLDRRWKNGLQCPECGSDARRPKCLFGLGSSCPRHDPDSYEPDPRQYVTDSLCSEAADEIARLRAREQEREPDGWLTPGDVARIRRGGPNVPSVNVWASQDEGDQPIYIGRAPEPVQGQEGEND